MLCKNCKYFKPDMSWNSPEHKYYYGACTHPTAIKTIAYHTGKIDYKYARDMRSDVRLCSEKARFHLDVNDVEPSKTTHIVSCTDCVYKKLNTKWYEKRSQIEHAFCTHPLVTKFDMISGEPMYPYTSDMRNTAEPNDMKSCGTNGFMFEEATDHNDGDSQTHEDSVHERFAQVLFVSLLVLLILL